MEDSGREDPQGLAEQRGLPVPLPLPLPPGSEVHITRLRTRALGLGHFHKPGGYSAGKVTGKGKGRPPASEIAKRFEPARRKCMEDKPAGLDNMTRQTAQPDRGQPEDAAAEPSQPNGTNLRRSTRKRRSTYMGMDSGSEADDARPVRGSRRHGYRSVNKLRRKEPPRREGLRPRKKSRTKREEYLSEEEYSEDEESDDQEETSSEEEDDEMEVGGAEEEDEGEQGEERKKARQKEQEGKLKQNGNDREVADNGEEEEGEEEDEGDEGDGRRRYALRSRTEVQRFSPRREEQASRARSPRKLYHAGTGTKRGREGRTSSSRGFKRQRAGDSDDSLLVDEMDPASGGIWARLCRAAGHPFLPPGSFGGDMNASAGWNLNATGTGWGAPNQNEHWGSIGSGTGAQTAGPTSKGGADIQPVVVDESVSFDQIGGLSSYINSLKEMVFFPLMYPNFFANYHITPPRGVLLCGPPGTGKTLVARALAAQASKAGKKVSFFMRKGADVLSKWVGEAERQLKALFEEAQRCQPSIIFFDEIDGLAPVRSSKQEQIHNSIVSTLLALMDGLDSRGQVVVIGATNRVDAIDSALRRPGRFDREFVFPLPDLKARAEILDIHTRNWVVPPTEELKAELAASCVGYCGADLKALCTEAAIRAFRKKYPQAYNNEDQYVLDLDSIEVGKRHFLEAMSSITPAAHRGALVHARPLPTQVALCLQEQVKAIMSGINEIFSLEGNDGGISSDEEETGEQLARLFSCRSSSVSRVYRPRFLVCGVEGTGLDYVGPAILHELEKYPVHSLSLPALLSDASAKSPEEALVHVFQEARRCTPSVLYLPQLQLWWETAHDQLRAVLLMLLSEVPPDLPVLLLGTASVSPKELDQEAFGMFGHAVYELKLPSAGDRRMLFSQMVESAAALSNRKARKKLKQKAPLPTLPKAPIVDKCPSEAELLARADLEEHAVRRLRMCLRDVCNSLLYEKQFSIFHYPVTDQDAPDYSKFVKTPMDVATLLQRVDSGYYVTRAGFVEDVELIPANAKAYNGTDYTTSRIYSRACALRDLVHGMLSQLEPALVAQCDAIAAQGGPTERPNAASRLPNPLEGSGIPIQRPTTSNEGLKQGEAAEEFAGEMAVESPPMPTLAVDETAGEPESLKHNIEELVPEEVGQELPTAGAAEFENSQNKPDSCKTQTSKTFASSVLEDAAETMEIGGEHALENGDGDDGDGRGQLDKHQSQHLVERLVLQTEGFNLLQLESVYARFCSVRIQKAHADIQNFVEDLVQNLVGHV